MQQADEKRCPFLTIELTILQLRVLKEATTDLPHSDMNKNK